MVSSPRMHHAPLYSKEGEQRPATSEIQNLTSSGMEFKKCEGEGEQHACTSIQTADSMQAGEGEQHACTSISTGEGEQPACTSELHPPTSKVEQEHTRPVAQGLYADH